MRKCLSKGLFLLWLAFIECNSFIRGVCFGVWLDTSVLNSFLLSKLFTLNLSWILFFNFCPHVMMMRYILTDASWTNCPGADKLWRIVKASEDQHSFLTASRHTQDMMSTLMKQERTICVLLPNKDQLDVTVGVSVYIRTSISALITKS